MRGVDRPRLPPLRHRAPRQRGGAKSSLSIALICTTRRRITASVSGNQEYENGDLIYLAPLRHRAPRQRGGITSLPAVCERALFIDSLLVPNPLYHSGD